MRQECKIAELGMLDMLFEMKNPITNIRLCLELLEAGDGAVDPTNFYKIIKSSAIDIEDSIRILCNSFHENGFSLYMDSAPTEAINLNDR